jgi:hypothetical protein
MSSTLFLCMMSSDDGLRLVDNTTDIEGLAPIL